MNKYSAWQYLLIDVANAFGLDKQLFEERIKWAEDNLSKLETMVDQAETKPLYIKACIAIRKAQARIPTGHLVALDACCSGIQVMSALTGCIEGARNTGLVDPNVRADAYSKTTEIMDNILGGGFHVSRKQAKEALMTSFYGSKAKPIELFGEDTPELNAFYQAAYQVAPGAWDLLGILLASWRPHALVHAWKLPDGYDARVKVMKKIDANDPRSRIEVDELDHASFTYEFYINEGSKKGLSNVANVVHSVDAYVLRCIHRRCNYDRAMINTAAIAIDDELVARNAGRGQISIAPTGKTAYYVEQFERSGMVDIVILPALISEKLYPLLSTVHLQKLRDIIMTMLEHKPFDVITVHDEFKCHPNHMNHLRQHYINIFAELAESNLLSDILSQLHGTPGTYQKLSTTLPQLICGSNYALS